MLAGDGRGEPGAGLGQRVAVVGTFNADRLLLRSEHGEPELRSEAGGLAYSLKALSRLRPDWRLAPVAWLAEEQVELFRPLVDQPGIDPSGVLSVPGPGNEVCLDCTQECKPELATLRYPPLQEADLLPALESPRLLLNCTSGRDVDATGWETFRRQWRQRHPRGWLQMDWHSLSLDWVAGRPRRLRRVPGAFNWVRDLDLLQLTLTECGSLVGRGPRSLEEAVDLAFRLRQTGCRRVVISDGPRGFLFVDGHSARRQPAWPVPRLVDTTGCGDVLGAALLATLSDGWPVERALALAAQAAGKVCAGVGLPSLDSLQAVGEA